jgi:hypothetical protein
VGLTVVCSIVLVDWFWVWSWAAAAVHMNTYEAINSNISFFMDIALSPLREDFLLV